MVQAIQPQKDLQATHIEQPDGFGIFTLMIALFEPTQGRRDVLQLADGALCPWQHAFTHFRQQHAAGMTFKQRRG